MSIVSLESVKRHLRTTHDMDDELIQELIDGAEDELKRFLDRDEIPRRDDPMVIEGQSDSSLDAASDSDDVAPACRKSVFFMVQAAYEGGTPDEIQKMIDIGLTYSRSYRRMGV